MTEQGTTRAAYAAEQSKILRKEREEIGVIPRCRTKKEAKNTLSMMISFE